MRYNVELDLEEDRIPKDKNRIILSFLKHNYESYDEEYFKSLYLTEKNKVKNFTFSLFMPNCEFIRDEIIIPSKKMILNYSTSDMKDGIYFYNAMLAGRGSKYKIKNNSIRIKNINMVQEKIIVGYTAVFTTMSPIVVREHNGNNKDTWYHSLSEEKGREVFINNLKYQLLDNFGHGRGMDIEEVDFQVLANKIVKIKYHGIVVDGNISRIKIKAKPYLLDYIYKAGVGGYKSSGFGMLNLV